MSVGGSCGSTQEALLSGRRSVDAMSRSDLSNYSTIKRPKLNLIHRMATISKLSESQTRTNARWICRLCHHKSVAASRFTLLRTWEVLSVDALDHLEGELARVGVVGRFHTNLRHGIRKCETMDENWRIIINHLLVQGRWWWR